MIKVGIIGLGHIGKVHLSALAALPEFKVVALCDLNSDLATLAPSNIPFDCDQSSFFKQDMDLVVVATPNQTHGEIGLAALRHGHGIVIEKPAARNISELNELLSLSEAKKLALHFAFHAAFGLEVIWAMEWLKDKEQYLGAISQFKCSFVDPYISPNGLIKYEAASLGDAWYDSGINALSVLACFLSLGALSVSKAKIKAKSKEDIVTDVTVDFGYSYPSKTKNFIGSIETRWTPSLNHKQTWFAFSKSNHELILDHSAQTVTLHKPGFDAQLLADFSHKGDRLSNHYMGVFKACAEGHSCTSDWHKMGKHSHELLFSASQMLKVS